ncbi:MAG: hypothetical protein H6Q28_1669, partial [Bacteroidetes bacterium]|nr:hypothetical protein [Bacteroidota bacterium]
VSLEILRVDTSGTEYAMARPVDGIRDQGTYILGLRSLRLPPGNYSVRLRAGATHLEQPLRIHP